MLTVLFVGLVFFCLFLLYKNLGAAVPAPITSSLTTPEKLSIPYYDFVYMSGRTWGVEVALIAAVIRKESNFNPNVVSSKKCYGLMQVSLMVCQDFGYVKDWKNPTADELSRIMDPQNNINIGTRQLSRLLAAYAFDWAIQMYNVGLTGFMELGYRAAGYLADIKRFYNEYKV